MITGVTRVGLVSDIHANSLALEAVLTDMPTVDAVLCAGGVVGYGPDPAACVEVIRSRSIPTAQGNHDWRVMAGEPYGSGDAYSGSKAKAHRL